ncbi:MAG: hypothetical protein LBH14_08375 [Desulfobulbaceae bacterium]|jgi:hypothetical protein|nr:hypothetical protein [Desulfobulbaceae bacterium]
MATATEAARPEGRRHYRAGRRWLKRLARQDGNWRPSPQLARQDQAKHFAERDQALRCAHCGHAITHPNQAITVSGGHEHTFVNPAGLVFTVRLFRDTPGCRFHGQPSPEFSWFPGYLWRFALCGGCGRHLGWLFQGPADHFTALIAAAIREAE